MRITWGVISFCRQIRCPLSGEIPTSAAILRTSPPSTWRGRVSGPRDDLCDLLVGDASGASTAGLVLETGQTQEVEALGPRIDAFRNNSQEVSNLRLLQAVGTVEHDGGAGYVNAGKGQTIVKKVSQSGPRIP